MDPQDDFKKGLGAIWYILEETKQEVKALHNKWDKVVALEVKIESLTNSVDALQKVLTMGNGQKSVVAQVAELRTRIEGVEGQGKKASVTTLPVVVDSAGERKERLANWGKVIGVLGLVISQVCTWFFLGIGK